MCPRPLDQEEPGLRAARAGLSVVHRTCAFFPKRSLRRTPGVRVVSKAVLQLGWLRRTRILHRRRKRRFLSRLVVAGDKGGLGHV